MNTRLLQKFEQLGSTFPYFIKQVKVLSYNTTLKYLLTYCNNVSSFILHFQCTNAQAANT